MFLKAFVASAIGILPLVASAGTLSGTASDRERMALPPEATFQAILYDISQKYPVEIARGQAPGDAGPDPVMVRPDATPAPLSGGILAGMMTYMADAAMFEDCVSGMVFPIAQEGDYLALERAYLADQSGAGAPLYVLLDGGIALRPAMEGPDRQMVIVERFIRTRPGMTCDAHRAGSALINTFWRLENLDGCAVAMTQGGQKPHLVLESQDTGAYRATVGCNRMRGAFDKQADNLTFSAAVSRRMACPPPLSALEQRFGAVLSSVAGYDFVGTVLILRDDSGAPIATFTAVSF